MFCVCFVCDPSLPASVPSIFLSCGSVFGCLFLGSGVLGLGVWDFVGGVCF